MQQQHPWPQTIEEAIAIQEQLRSLVIAENQRSTVRYVAGVDVGYDHADIVSRAAVTVKPIYVSIGQKVNLTVAIEYVLSCARKYRLPETTRSADQLTSG